MDPARRWRVVDDDGVGTEYDLVDYGPVPGLGHPVFMSCNGKRVWTGRRTSSEKAGAKAMGFRTEDSKLPPAVLRRLLPLVKAGDPGAPTAPTQDQAALLEELSRCASTEPAGTLLIVRELRARSSIPTKARFDAAALALAQQGRLTLHHHDHPHGLSDAARNALVFAPTHGERGIYYVGISPRGPRS